MRPLGPAAEPDYPGLIQRRFGLRLSAQQMAKLTQALDDMLPGSGYADAAALYDVLAAGRRPELLDELVSRLTIHETHFFRVEPQIEALRRTVLPDLVQRRAGERRLKLWSAGCSTGEEPYTLAILVREQLPAADQWTIDIRATDLSQPAIDAARRATYGAWSFRDTPERARQTYFREEGRTWRPIEAIRGMVRFERLNLADPAPWAPGEVDLVLCRNVTIYFDPATTQQVYGRFAEALRPDGWLVLGPSDPTPPLGGPFEAVYLPGAVLWRRARPPAAAVAAPAPPRSTVAASAPPRPRAAQAGAATAAPPTATPSLEEAWRLAHAGQRPAARAMAEQLAASAPLEAGAHLLHGMLLLEEGAVDPALASLRRAVFLDPASPLAQLELGRAQLRLGDRVRARASIGQARRLLAGLPEGQVLGPGAATSAELRPAVDALLTGLARGEGAA